MFRSWRHARPDTCYARRGPRALVHTALGPTRATLRSTRSVQHALRSARHARHTGPCSHYAQPGTPNSHHARPDTHHTRRAMLGPTRTSSRHARPTGLSSTTPGLSRATLEAPCSARHALHSTHHARPMGLGALHAWRGLVRPGHVASGQTCCVHACFARGATLGPTRAMPDAPCSAHAPRCTPRSARHAPRSSRHAQST